jgi:hypothetical protein
MTTVTAPGVLPFDLTLPGGPPYQLLISFDFKDFTGDPAHPPTLLGVRLVP